MADQITIERIVQYVEETAKVMKTPDLTNTCVICDRWLHDPAVFPKDFPNEWKMCCSCHGYAKEIVEKGNVRKVIDTWITIIRAECREKFIETLTKIDKLISVV